MFISLLARVISNITCYLYPAYASYKALAIKPYNGQDATYQTERWLMYWAVVGCWTAMESIAWWLLYLIPFYSLIKCCFFLWLSLPQTEGSTYVYRTQLAPLFDQYEYDIDQFLASLQGRAGSGLVALVNWMWVHAKGYLNLAAEQSTSTFDSANAQSGSQRVTSHVPSDTSPQPPTIHDPASGVVRQALGFASRYAGGYAPVIAFAWQNMTAQNLQASQSRVADRDDIHQEQSVRGYETFNTSIQSQMTPVAGSYTTSRSGNPRTAYRRNPSSSLANNEPPLESNLSRSASNDSASGWGDMSAFEDIGEEGLQVDGHPDGKQGNNWFMLGGRANKADKSKVD